MYLVPVVLGLLVIVTTPGRADDSLLPPSPKDFLLITVATNATDGYRRFIKSAQYHSIPYKVLGFGEKWEGGTMRREGGGHKVNLLKGELESLIQNPKQIVMFTDGYDVILTSGVEAILKKFTSFESRVVFSAEYFCWPDESLMPLYPSSESPYKYLNSGGFIGYASDLYELISSHPIGNRDDDQLYYTKMFLDKKLREKHRIRLDTRANIFQNLNGAEGDLKVVSDEGDESHVFNTVHATRPSVIHGNGPSKVFLNSIGNYIGSPVGWHKNRQAKLATLLHPSPVGEDNATVVLISVFISQATPFLQEFLEKIEKLDYPKEKTHLFLYNNVDAHITEMKDFLELNRGEYASIKEVKPLDRTSESHARTLSMEHCLLKKCDHYLSLDSIAHLDNPQALRILISANRTLIGPMLVRPYKAWSNFWGALNADGFYARSFDYMDIVNNEKRGVWNIAYLSNCYLVSASLLPAIKSGYDAQLDPDMAFCNHLRQKDIFMYVDNSVDFGHLVDADGYSSTLELTHPELYQLHQNQWDWERRYIHPDYPDNFEPNNVPKQPCPDVYWFPIVTPRFCTELIDVMEAFGKWSTGSNVDERLTGGYENVPTRDIHMNQVGMERQWLHFLHLYVRPLQELVFTGYFHDPPRSLMNFVVRYKPDEQPLLRPHHDSSTYTINIALNTPKVDYQGGGCRFIRYNCSVQDTRLGWLLMHPGRLTHFHEGLRVTSGTRYIMISFVDP